MTIPWARLRVAFAWLGIAFFAVVAVLATLHLARDIVLVATNISSLALLREVGFAAAVIAGGAIWLAVVVRIAGRPGNGPTAATVAAFGTLLAVRLAIAFAYEGEMGGEAGVYDNLARGVLEGECCGSEPVSRPMGYPVMLGIAYALMGRTTLAVEALNILFAIGIGVAILALARSAYGPRVGAVAVLLYALWPAGALLITSRLPQTSYDLAIVVAAWAAVATRPGWRGSALAGALLGLSQYLRPTSPLLIPAFLLARIWPGGPWRRLLGGALVPMVVAFLVVLVPIMAWNLSTRGVPDISTSAYGGKSLHHGTDVRSGGRWSRRAADELDVLAGPGTWEQSSVGMRIALERIRDDPVGIALLGIRKQYTLWGGESYGVRYGIRRELASRPFLPRSILPSLASGIFYAVVMAATALGLYLRRHRTDALSALLIATAFSISLLHSLVEVRDRYHSYAMPLLMPIAALAIVALMRRVRWLRGEDEAERLVEAEGPARGIHEDQAPPGDDPTAAEAGPEPADPGSRPA
jgi:hypothetical protein